MFCSFQLEGASPKMQVKKEGGKETLLGGSRDQCQRMLVGNIFGELNGQHALYKHMTIHICSQIWKMFSEAHGEAGDPG